MKGKIAQIELRIAGFLFIVLMTLLLIPVFYKEKVSITGATAGLIEINEMNSIEKNEDEIYSASDNAERLNVSEYKENNGSNEQVALKSYQIIGGSSKRSSGSSSDSSNSVKKPKIVNNIENEKGKIEFSEPVDISDVNIIIEKNRISVEPGLNVPATLTLNGIYYFNKPLILKDGVECNECNIIDYSNGKVVFSIPHFSTFTTSGCNNVEDDSIINESGNYTICAGTYNVTDANEDGVIIINASNVVIDCNSSLIIGNNSGIGIVANGTTAFNKTENVSWADWEDAVNQSTFLENVTIKNCEASNFKKGIFASINKNLELDGNIAHNNVEAGIMVGGLINSMIRNNIAYENGNNESGADGIDFGISVNSYVLNNSASNNSRNGIGVMAINNSVVSNNSALYNNESGISVWIATQNSVFSENTISFNNKGISLSGGTGNNSIKQNRIEQNDIGISLSNLWLVAFIAGLSGENKGNNISENILNNIEYDLTLVDSKDSPPEDCSWKRSWDKVQCQLKNGFRFRVSGNGTVTKNLIENNWFGGNGIYVSNVKGNTIVLNNFTNGYVSFASGDINETNNSIEFNMVNGTLDYGNNPYVCKLDLECDDGNPDTKDVCNYNSEDYRPFNTSVATCSNFIYNLYGKIVDENGNPVVGANLSFYSASLYDPINDTGNYSFLIPKEIPDAVTDENGSYKAFMPFDDLYHIVIQGSDKKDFNLKNNRTKQSIILPESGFVEVTFEKASAYLKSDLYFENSTPLLLAKESTVGTQSNLGYFNGGEELKFFIRVNGTPWNLGIYDHYSDTKYAIIERLDYDTWRIYFEDLPSNNADWDFNDAVILVDLLSSQPNASEYDNDCDNDGIKNWDDSNDSYCDIGRHDTDVFENNTDFNVEGHIEHSGEYEHVNNYTCGDIIRFSMFGRNFGSTPLNITFVVENHTIDGGPTSNRFCENNTDLVYCGNSSNPTETLELPPDGQKYHKLFNFTIPCDFAPEDNSTRAKYDIHVYDNIKWGRMHKIGNFFVVKDVTPPQVALLPRNSYTNMGKITEFVATAPPQENTMGVFYMMIIKDDERVNVTIDKDITYDSDGNGDPSDDADFIKNGSILGYVNITYNQSGHYTIKLTAREISGPVSVTYGNITVYVTDEEAKEIFRERMFAHCLNGDATDIYASKLWDGFVDGIFDKYDDWGPIGIEYRTEQPGSNDTADFTDDEWLRLLNWTTRACELGTPFLGGIPLGTWEEVYNGTETFFSSLIGCASIC